jgi:hypothetical protein
MTGKLQPHYQGPCQLIRQITPITFTARRLDDNVNLDATNTDRMKPYTEPITDRIQTRDRTPIITSTNDKQQGHRPNRTHRLPMRYLD